MKRAVAYGPEVWVEPAKESWKEAPGLGMEWTRPERTTQPVLRILLAYFRASGVCKRRLLNTYDDDEKNDRDFHYSEEVH